MDKILEDTWRDRLLIWGLLLIASPVLLPWLIWDWLAFRWRLWRYLRGSTPEAWERCARLWAATENAYGSVVGPNMETPFAHTLAEQFIRYHPNARTFLTGQLANSDPYLAAYAFKCLIRFRPISIDDIPPPILARSDQIKASRWGCIVDTLTLGDFIRDYFSHEAARVPRNV